MVRGMCLGLAYAHNKGIVHSEKVSDEILATGQKLHGIQTWVALPVEAEEIDPRFEHYPADRIPRKSIDGGDLCVIIGSAYGLESPVSTESDTLYVEVNLAAGHEIDLPKAEEVGLYVVDGEVSVGGQTIAARRLAVLENDAEGTIEATADCKFMLCGGATLAGERYIWWNYVSSSRERLEQAKDDWRDGRFEMVPGETDFIPLPEI